VLTCLLILLLHNGAKSVGCNMKIVSFNLHGFNQGKSLLTVGPLACETDVALGLRCCNQYDSSFYTCRSWRSFSYDDFERDLLQSDLVRCPPDDVSELIAAYDDTVRSLIDIHAPYRRMRRSKCWFDAECRAAKRTTRSLERANRRQPSAETLSPWKFQFSSPRGLFRRKATE